MFATAVSRTPPTRRPDFDPEHRESGLIEGSDVVVADVESHARCAPAGHRRSCRRRRPGSAPSSARARSSAVTNFRVRVGHQPFPTSLPHALELRIALKAPRPVRPPPRGCPAASTDPNEGLKRGRQRVASPRSYDVVDQELGEHSRRSGAPAALPARSMRGPRRLPQRRRSVISGHQHSGDICAAARHLVQPIELFRA